MYYRVWLIIQFGLKTLWLWDLAERIIVDPGKSQWEQYFPRSFHCKQIWDTAKTGLKAGWIQSLDVLLWRLLFKKNYLLSLVLNWYFLEKQSFYCIFSGDSFWPQRRRPIVSSDYQKVSDKAAGRCQNPFCNPSVDNKLCLQKWKRM